MTETEKTEKTPTKTNLLKNKSLIVIAGGVILVMLCITSLSLAVSANKKLKDLEAAHNTLVEAVLTNVDTINTILNLHDETKARVIELETKVNNDQNPQQ